VSTSRLFDKAGVPLPGGEIDAMADRSWVLNGIGQANITIAKTDASCTDTLLRFGNRILIQEDDMGTWGGIILPPRNWTADGITVTAYTIEKLLEHRYPGASSYAGYAGDIFEDLITSANSTDGTLIDFGSAYAGGESWTEETTDTIYKALAAIAKRTGQDWEIEPGIDSVGNIAWTAYWTSARGQDLSDDIVLEEGTHFKIAGGPLLIEQGPIYNQIKLEAYSGSTTTTVTSDIDATSRAKYGLLQGKFTEAVPATYTAQTYCDYLLSVYKEPRRTFKISVINDDVDTLKALELGNTITLFLATYGFSGNGLGTTARVRILVKEADERDSTLTLVVNEVA